MNNKRLANISFLKTMMMLIIVLCHSCSFFTGRWFSVVPIIEESTSIALLANFTGFFHVQTFTMASGFLFYYLKSEKKKYKNPKKDITNRAKRLLIPYLFSSILWVIPIGYYFYKYSFKEIFINFFLMVNPSQLWFLIMLFWVFVFFEIISSKISVNNKNLLIIYVISTILGSGLSHLGINYFQISTSIRYILYFYLGGYIYNNKNKITLKQTMIMFITSIMLYCSYIYLNHIDLKITNYIVLFIEPLMSSLLVSSFYYFCDVFTNNNKIILESKIYELLENSSFGVYLFHQQIIYFTIILFNGKVQPIIQVLISFVISLLISLMITNVLKKNCFTKKMFGL